MIEPVHLQKLGEQMVPQFSTKKTPGFPPYRKHCALPGIITPLQNDEIYIAKLT
jgi:hypothetical protein